MSDYHLIQAYRNSGYYEINIQDSADFVGTHTDFLLLDAPNPTKPESEGAGPSTLFDTAIRPSPQFHWKVINRFGSADTSRNLVWVHRVEPLPWCK